MALPIGGAHEMHHHLSRAGVLQVEVYTAYIASGLCAVTLLFALISFYKYSTCTRRLL
jgi:hypothetical protein